MLQPGERNKERKVIECFNLKERNLSFTLYRREK